MIATRLAAVSCLILLSGSLITGCSHTPALPAGVNANVVAPPRTSAAVPTKPTEPAPGNSFAANHKLMVSERIAQKKKMGENK